MRLMTFGMMIAAALSGGVLAHEVTLGDIQIIHPHIAAPFAGAKSAAAYMVIANEGDQADRLIGVETPAAKMPGLHATDHGADGIARMQPRASVDVPAGDTVVLEPGGLHIMLMGLTAPLTIGQMVPGVLIFERAGRIEVEFSVDPADGVDHSTMDHTTAGQD